MNRFGLFLMSGLVSLVVYAQKMEKPMKDILTEYTFPTNSVMIDTMQIAYSKVGNGSTTLLFIHGLSSNSDAWHRNIEKLQERYTCIAIDLPGYGKSSIVDAPYTPTFFAEVVYKFVRSLQLENVILVGHSMGGQASIRFAERYPEKISKLILIAPAGIETFTEPHRAILKNALTAQLVAQTSDAQIEKNYALNFHNFPSEAQHMMNERKRIKKASDFQAHCEAIVKSIAGMVDDPVFNSLSSIEIPTLVLFGKEDRLIPNGYLNPSLSTEAIGLLAKEQIRNTTLHFIPDSGHFVHFEKPEAVNTYIELFVSAH